MKCRLILLAAVLTAIPLLAGATEFRARTYELPTDGGHPHDVAVGADGTVWYTAQRDGRLGRLDPATGKIDLIPLGSGSSPHGVIIGPDGAPWITDAGMDAILRFDPKSGELRRWPLPPSRSGANLNTAVFDRQGRIWFTGQSGIYGRLDPATGAMQIWDAPRGVGPYGITVTPGGDIYYASLAGNYLGRIDPETGAATVIQPPNPNQGARRVWSDSKGRVWVSEWNAGALACYDARNDSWQTWKLPGRAPHAYAVYVDDEDKIWVSDWGANALLRFDPETGAFQTFPLQQRDANVRQLNGRGGEVWAPESGADRIVGYSRR